MDKRRIFKVIGIYELIFGIGGIVLTFLSLDFQSSIKLSFGIFSLLLFSTVGFAGLNLYKQQKTGFMISVIVQLIQLFNFNVYGLKYIFCSGSKISILFPSIDIDFAVFMEHKYFSF